MALEAHIGNGIEGNRPITDLFFQTPQESGEEIGHDAVDIQSDPHTGLI
jgi:hypothetical protein